MLANAVDSLYNGALTGQRAQTVRTPQSVVDAVCETFGAQIAFDPVYAPDSLTNPESYLIAPWAEIWARVTELLAAHGTIDAAAQAAQILRWEKRAGDFAPPVRNLAKTVAAQVMREFAHTSGHVVNWPDRTFVNPPYGDKGPECILAAFADFCAKFAATQTECALLCPVRSHRKWWRRDVLVAADAIAYLDPIRFEGFAQSFPAPLCVAYKGPHAYRMRRAFARLGDTVVKGLVPELSQSGAKRTLNNTAQSDSTPCA